MVEVPDFAGLRRRGIADAQEASGQYWTDYNVHDPGVTLLEQFAYALTEVVYRAELPVEDLLTGSDGRIDHARLRLGLPEAVLQTRPVTVRDLALALGEDASVGRVIVSARSGAEAGRYDLHVIPADGAAPEAALTAVRRGFHARRNLCEDLASIGLARPVPCRLEARIEVHRREPPERTAALIYDRCARLIRDRRAMYSPLVVSPSDAFDDPSRLFRARSDPDGGADFLDAFFAALTRLGEVDDVAALHFRRLGGPESNALVPLAPGEYRTLVVPERTSEVGLRLVSRGMDVVFDLAGMRVEFARLQADREAVTQALLESAPGAERASGRRRRFGHLPLAEGLPAAYNVGRTSLPSSVEPMRRSAAGQLRGYLALSDGLLGNLNADLEALPELFAGDEAEAPSYYARPLDFGPMPELAVDGPGAMASAVAAADPGHGRRERLLDYLLALRGEAFPQNALRLFDLYRGPAARQRALLENRARLLAEIDVLDRDRAAAPDYSQSERCHERGIGRKLTILLDYPDRGTAPLSAALRRAGLTLEESVGPVGDWLVPRGRIAMADDPLAMLVPRLDAVEPIAPARLLKETAFLADRRIGADALHRGVSPVAYVLSPFGAGWRLWLDPGLGGALFACGAFAARSTAVMRANQLREFLIGLNRRSEGLYVVEEALLGASPLHLALVQPGWTARTARPDFRRLAEETMALVCPAHLTHRVIWLDHEPMAAFEALHLAWRVAYRDAAAGERGAALERSAAALRGFLAEAE